MKEFITKLEEWFQPIQDFIIANYNYVKIGFWIFIAFLIFFNIIKDIAGRSK